MIRLQMALHRLLRLVLPGRIRRLRGADMDRTFLEMLRDDDRGLVVLWASEIRDLVRTGARLRKQEAAPRRLIPSLGISWLDVKLGLRMIFKYPGLTAVAVLALAIGIPIGLAPWHLVNAIEAPLPVDEPQRVRVIRYWNEATSSADLTRLDDFVRWQETLTSFETLGAVRRGVYNVNADEGVSPPVRGAEISASTFDILRTPPAHGRALLASDEAPGAPEVVLIGYHLWQGRLGGDPEVVGSDVRIGGVSHTVVGVMPPGFFFPERDQLWLPLREQLGARPFEGRPLIVFGRLADDVSPDDAVAELEPVVAGLASEFPRTHQRLRGEVVPFAVARIRASAGGMRAELGYYVIQLLVLLTLLVACTNVGMLLFARTATRSEELAVRSALGAGRGRIVGQLFVESLVLTLLAVGVALFAADRLLNWMQSLVGGGLPYWVDLGVSRETSLRALGLAVLSALVAGILPAVKSTGKAVQQNLQRAAARRSGARFGGVFGALIVLDVALAVTVIGLAGASLDNLSRLDINQSLGIRPDQFLSISVQLPESAVEGMGHADAFRARVAATQRELVERLEAEPGVRGVAIGSDLPRMDHPGRRIEIDGPSLIDDPDGHRVQVASVTPEFFDGLGQPILLGRGFDGRDLGETRSTVIVNTTFVDEALGGANPIGRRLRYKSRNGGEPGPWLEIVGVVPRLGMNAMMPGDDDGVYHPLAPGELHPVLFGIHVGDNPLSFVPSVRELLAEVDPMAVAVSPAALDEVIQDDLVTMIMVTWGGAMLVGVLVLLAASGIYAIMSFSVAQRTREIGIRTSLGAQRRDIVSMVSRRALAQLGVGALLGFLALWRLLFELNRDMGWIPGGSPLLLTLAAAAAVVVLIGLPACLTPTMRALRVRPSEALRSGG